jgi:hypothetical protein
VSGLQAGCGLSISLKKVERLMPKTLQILLSRETEMLFLPLSTAYK